MAYQFFAKGRPSAPVPTPVASPPPHRRPSIHPPPVQPPAAAKSRPNQSNQDEYKPYPHAIPAGYTTPHPHVTVETVGTGHIPSLARITGLLLPIRYSNSFYTATITDPVIASLSRVAIYHEHPVTAVPESGASVESDKVIGGIRCQLERPDPQHEATNLYIQTLHLLSPYRGHGVAASLLNALLFETPPTTTARGRVSELVKHYNIRSVAAHVHEANEDGLAWYVARGFKIQDGVVEGYYRRLKPSGARIVRLDLPCEDAQESPVQEERPESPPSSPQDEDWEKVEAEDGEEDDHGIQLSDDSQEEAPSRKRKAEDEKGNQPQRR
ncbi:hypothetical protein PENDEC_c006G05356 [Penicillium decumbens]|uniref:N-acetyltransferase domain-containing protein n=1 Tax=Penicillium decumbens TaxID=69771 RepID=A0A1V6PFB9_PENDC|nr:hypothetical protein PENDEC_c006G05356 [Penicillium decumbens]